MYTVLKHALHGKIVKGLAKNGISEDKEIRLEFKAMVMK